MNISLTPNLEVRPRKSQSGLYNNASEVVQEALAASCTNGQERPSQTGAVCARKQLLGFEALDREKS